MPALAQSTAALRGLVTDAQGGALPGAAITIRNQATGEERTTVSDRQGDYRIPALTPGLYRLEVRMDGFQPQVVTDLRLEVAQVGVQDVRLSVGSLTEEISVVGEAPVIESSTTSIGTVISERTVQEIPLNGRHFVDLGLLIPGSVAPSQNGFLTAPLRGQGSFAFNTAGNREDTVNFMVNGINLNDQVQNQITFQPSINTVSEFKVDNQTLSAEYGRSSGAVVNIATRSGTNDLHGEVFEFFRHQDVDARNFFNPESQPQSPFKRHQFGAALGGPIIKNKTFFFVSYEGLRQRQQLDFNSGALSDAQRDAVTDPVVRNLLPLLPRSNATSPTGAPRFIGTGTANVDIDQLTGDVNHQLGASDRIHLYYVYQRDERGEPNLQGNTIPGFGDTRGSNRQIGTLNHTHIFGPNLVNEARFGFNRIDISFDPNVQDNPADYGIRNGITTAVVLPQITVQGVGLNFGGPAGFPQGRTDTTFVLSDTLSHQRGAHALKVGAEYRSFKNINFGINGGTFTYPSLADFQAGRGTAFTVQLGGSDSEVTQKAFGMFIQDNFRVRANLSLELGLRYDLNVSPTEANDRFVYFDPASVSLQQVGQGVRDKIYGNKNNWQPRIGVVWDPFGDGRTAVRAAYALSGDQPVTNMVTPTAANPPLVTPLTFTGPAGSIRLDNAQTVAQASGLAPTRGRRLPQPARPDLERERAARAVEQLQRDGRLLRLEGRAPARVAEPQPVRGRRRPYPASPRRAPSCPTPRSATSRRSRASATRTTRRLDHGQPALLARPPGERVLHAVGVEGHELTELPGRGRAGQHEHRGRLRALRLQRHAPLRRERDLGAAVQGQPLQGGLAARVITQGQTGNPINIVTNLNFSATPTSGPTVGPVEVFGRPEQWFSTGICDPAHRRLLHGGSALPCRSREATTSAACRATRSPDPASTTPTCRS